MPPRVSRRARTDLRFTGRIAGVGTSRGPRFVVGMWETSPLGRFVDVMVEDGAGHRILLAPSPDVADFVSATYTFDEVRFLPVSWRKVDGGLRVVAGGPTEPVLDLRLGIGGISGLGMLLRAVPSAFATAPGWLRLIDPIARVLVPGSATAGTAGGDRREYYGVTLARRIVSLEGTWEGADLGVLARLDPPVTFGFGSAPASPSLVDVTTTIR
ncbi:hypothetical protein [Frondihabitans cladoniiphilus]|uniref:Uncharacterized protein n=1 Tax=Frondihabitans cladoniiphilus TaxID=715785 RepID=A0ABP8W8S9_9MICO